MRSHWNTNSSPPAAERSSVPSASAENGAPGTGFASESGESDGAVVFTVAIDGDLVVTGGADGSLRIWQWQTGSMLGRIDHAHGDMEVMCAAIKGDRIASAGGAEVKMWSARDRSCTATMMHAGFVRAVAFGQSVLLSVSEDTTCNAWPLDAGEGGAIVSPT